MRCPRVGWQIALRLKLILAACIAPLTPAHAQSVEDGLPLTDDPTDPIGLDREPEPEAEPTPGAAPSGKANAAQYGPESPPVTAQVGEALTAPGSVREHAHRLWVELSHGLARVSVQMELENSGEKPAEAIYRVAVPQDAALFGLEVCNDHGCRNGVADPSRARLNAYDDAVQARPTASRSAAPTLPAADARVGSDARGSALIIRAATVSPGEPLRIRVDYVAQASEHANVARVQLPARGMDPRAAPTTLRVRAQGYEDVQVNRLPLTAEGELQLDAWTALEISARSTGQGARTNYWDVACGKLHCVRAYASASAVQPAPAEIFLAIDASPSTEGAARSRLLVTVAALLARAPPGSHVRALRFASRAAPLQAERKPARELSLSVFAPIAFEAELGAATRFESAWQVIAQTNFVRERGRKLVIIVGDGGLTTGSARPFEAARQKGVEVAVVNVADRPSMPALRQGARLTGGAVVEAGAEADAAARGAAADPLEERLAALYQPSRGMLRIAHQHAVPLELRAGDSVVWEAAVSVAPALFLGSRALPRSAAPRPLAPAVAAHAAHSGGVRRPPLVAVDRADLEAHRADRPDGQDRPAHRGVHCDRRGPARRVSGLSTDGAPVLLAQERATCAVVATKAQPPENQEPEFGVGMPSSPLLSMLRQRIVPVARGCFRRDRAGRADYQVRAVFVFELADREVLSAAVQGTIAQALRDCLLTAVDSLAVPRFTGRVVVRYPLVTEREPLPSQIELTPETAGKIDSLTSQP